MKTLSPTPVCVHSADGRSDTFSVVFPVRFTPRVLDTKPDAVIETLNPAEVRPDNVYDPLFVGLYRPSCVWSVENCDARAWDS